MSSKQETVRALTDASWAALSDWPHEVYEAMARLDDEALERAAKAAALIRQAAQDKLEQRGLESAAVKLQGKVVLMEAG